MSYTQFGPIHYRYATLAIGDYVATYREQFYAVKETEKGYWVVPSWCIPLPDGDSDKAKTHRRWVSKTSRKRYCYPSTEEAWESYKARCAFRVKHLERQLVEAKAALRIEKPTDKVQAWPSIFEEFSQ